MALKPTHEIHERRMGRNLGVGIILVTFVGLIFALTIVKVTSESFQLPNVEELE